MKVPRWPKSQSGGGSNQKSSERNGTCVVRKKKCVTAHGENRQQEGSEYNRNVVWGVPPGGKLKTVGGVGHKCLEKVKRFGETFSLHKREVERL